MNVVVVDSGGANIGSICYALNRLGVSAQLSGDAATIAAAERVILPGVGAAGPAMARLHALDLVPTLKSLRQPLLGICLGMQLLFEHSEEGSVGCLGLLPGHIGKLPVQPGIRVPHMGWNRLQRRRAGSLLDGIDDGDFAYFVHSYAAPVSEDCIASCRHGGEFAAVVQRGHVMGAQFHPERSGVTGRRMLENFLRQEPT